MPRGKRPNPIKRLSQSDLVTNFAGRIENAAPEWLTNFIERKMVLEERFHERDDEGKYVCSASEQAKIHQILAVAEGGMMKFAALREQHLKERGLSAYVEREGGSTTNILNFSPSMTPEQRAYAERLFLASVSGKEVEPPTRVIEATVSNSQPVAQAS